jgi:putative transposase
VYLHAYDSISQARAGLERYLTFYNAACPHSSLGGKTPNQIYVNLTFVEDSSLTKATA